MFVDDWLIEEQHQVRLQMTPPERKEIVLTFEEEWEGVHSIYVSVLQDNRKIRLYYRGNSVTDHSEEQVTCYAESEDGIHFTKPNLGIIDSAGSTNNNIVLKGKIAHNFAPFYDQSPHVLPIERYKAVGGVGSSQQTINNQATLYALASEDGIHWRMMQEEPVMADGAFDSQNIAFWDRNIRAYRCYNRYFTDQQIRGIQSAISNDFIHWGPQQVHLYGAGIPLEHFYTNATIPCPGAEHIYLSFPMRLVLNRKKVLQHHVDGVSDAIFMTSRDGIRWDRTFMEAWLRPGLEQRNWTDRNNAVAYGCAETGEHEISFYVTEQYRWPSVCLRRVTVRKHGFASVHAGYAEGSFTTRPLIFSGQQLLLNYSTSAIGFIQVEIADSEGRVIDGMSFDDMEPLYGDEIEGAVIWKSGRQLGELEGQPVRIRFRVQDADLYAMRVL